MTTSPTIIPIHTLHTPLPSVDLGPSGIHPVAHISGTAMQLVHHARDQGNALDLWEAAALCVPTATREAVLDCSIQQIEAIIAIASGLAERVLEEVAARAATEGNAAAPATGDPPVPAS